MKTAAIPYMKRMTNDTDETVFSLNQDTIEMLTEIANPTLISLTYLGGCCLGVLHFARNVY